jgi:hypothetical protein
MFVVTPQREFSFRPPRDERGIAAGWRDATSLMVVPSFLMAVLLGGMLGGTGIVEEIQNRTAGFLLTRPRPRSYFHIVRWTVITGEIASFSFAASASLFFPLYFFTRRVGPPSFLWLGAGLFVLATLVFALTDLFTLLLGNVRDGWALSLGLVFAWILSVPTVNKRMNMNLPSLTSFFGELRPEQVAPNLQFMAVWLGTALACAVLSSIILLRKEL